MAASLLSRICLIGFARPINSTMCSQSSGVTLVVSRFLLAPIPLSKDAAHLRFSFYPAYQIILVSVSFLTFMFTDYTLESRDITLEE